MSDLDKQTTHVLQDIISENIKEQRRSRRWGIFFKIIYIVLAFFILSVLVGEVDSDKKLVDADKITAVVNIKGIIMDGADASAKNVIPDLQKAFEHEKTKGVIIYINSPGGSPVQSAYINDEIRRLKKKHKIPVYAVVSDVCASGGYYIAVAADKIYANTNSIVGSIGVLMDGFGFVKAMQNFGIERRLLTAGKHKGILDPFSPVSPQATSHIKTMLEHTHQEFINVVKQGRGKRLKNDPKIFTGLFWTGKEAKKLGLVDGIASSDEVARNVIGAEEIVTFSTEKDFIEKLTENISMQIISNFMDMTVAKPALR